MKEKFYVLCREGMAWISFQSAAHCRIGSSAPVFFFTGKGVGTLFYFLGWVLIIYCYFRVFSRNISKRYAENQKYLAKTYKLRTYIQQQKNSLAQRKVYHIYKCPGCKQKIRIPERKGKDRDSLSKCGTTFIKKS